MPTPSACSRRCSQRPHGSSPTPLPSDVRAPQRAATTAAFAGAPPLCGTNASASSKPATGRSQKRSTSDSPRHRTDTREKYQGLRRPQVTWRRLDAPPSETLDDVRPCPPRLRAGRRRSRLPSPAAPSHFGTRRCATSRRTRSAPSSSRTTASRSGTTAGTAATTCCPTACCSRRWPRCCRRCGPPRWQRSPRMAVRSHRARALGRAGGVGGPVVRRARRGCAARERLAGVRARCCLRARRAARVAARPAPLAVALAVGSALASPVAAAFLALVCAVGALYSARRAALLWTVGAALVPLAVLGLLFPESGQFPFWFSAWWPLALFCTLALLATRGDEGEREVRAATAAYLALATFAVVLPNPLGGNMTRLGSLFGGPVLLAIVLTRAPRRVTPVVVAALVVGLGLAGDHADPPDFGEPRRPVHRTLLLPAAGQLAGSARRAARAHRDPARRSTTGRRRMCRRVSRSRAGGCASSTSSATGSSTRASSTQAGYRRGCSRRAFATSQLRTRASTTRRRTRTR